MKKWLIDRLIELIGLALFIVPLGLLNTLTEMYLVEH